MKVEQHFEVEISKILHDKIVWLINNYDKEIGCWLIGEIKPDKIIIEDFLIPFQEVGGASVDTSGSNLVKLRKEYGDKCKKIIGHFHSHNTMSAYWSSTDEDFIKEYTEPRGQAVFIVSSKSDGHRVRLEITKPFKLSFDELEYTIIDENSEVANELKEAIKTKLTEKIYTKSEGWGDWLGQSNHEGLTKQQINKMVYFNNKTNNVFVRNLSLTQYYQLENLFPIETEVYNLGRDTYTIQYKTETKEKAIELMKDLKDFMREEFKDDTEYLDEEEISEKIMSGYGGWGD